MKAESRSAKETSPNGSAQPETPTRFVHVLALLAVASCLLLSPASPAQDTNFVFPLPPTKMESLETNVGAIIIKASTDTGTVSANSGNLAVKYKETTDTSTGEKAQGIGIEMQRASEPRAVLLIDYDELAPLLTALDYFNRLDVSVTTLNSFDAAYTTKGGFRIAALGNRRTGQIQFGVRDMRIGSSPIALSREQMTHLWQLIDEAKRQLDILRK